MNPTFQIVADKRDITAEIKDRLLRLTVTDSAGIKSDTAEITLDDYLNALAADVRQAYARLDITVWQDQAREIDKDKLRRFFLAGGALDLDIRIVRVPRHNVRAEAVLKAERLRDKIRRMAELRGEEVEWSILAKADSLEDSLSPDDLISELGRAA